MDTAQQTIAGSPRTSWLRWTVSIGLPVMLVLATVAVYANSLRGVLVFDDAEHIVDNPAIRQLWPITAVARSGGSRPLLPVTLAMNYAIGGLEVTGYHVFNIAIHVIAGLALYGLVRRTLRLPSMEDRFRESAITEGIAWDSWEPLSS